MADYARQGNNIRASRSLAEQVRRIRVARPKRGHAPVIGWHLEGDITYDRDFTPQLVRLEEDDPWQEYKDLIGFDGYLKTGGPITINWRSNDGYLLLGHQVTTAGAGNANRVFLGDPFIVENGTFNGEFILPEIDTISAASTHLAVYALFRKVPV